MGLLEKIQKINEDTPSEIEVLQAIVVEESPLKISIIGDPKRQITSELIVVPEHLTDHKISISITDTSVSGSTNTADSHSHDIQSFALASGTLTLKNHLKRGDIVMCVAYNYGQTYLVVDRVR